MMDTYDDCVSKKHGKKYSHGKKNLKSKFTSGFKSIFHQGKPMKRASSMPSVLQINPVETLGVHPKHSVSLDVDTLFAESETRTVHGGIPRVDKRPSSACFTYPVGSNMVLPQGTNNFLSLPLPTKHNVRGKLNNYHKNDKLRVGHAIREQKAQLDIVPNTYSIYDDVPTDEIDVFGQIIPPRDIVDTNNNIKKGPTLASKILPRWSSLEILDGTDKSLGYQKLAIKNNNLYNKNEATNKKIKNALSSPRLTNNTNSDIKKKVKQPPTTNIDISSTNSSVSSAKRINKNGNSHDEEKVTSPTNLTLPSPPRIKIKQRSLSDSSELSDDLTLTPRLTQSARGGTDVWNDSNKCQPISRSRSHCGDLRLTHRHHSSDVNGMVCDVDKSTIETVIQDIIQLLLIDKKYNEKLVTRWCKDICVRVRDSLLRVNELRHKIVVSAHIASKVRDENLTDTIHVATRCQADASNDRFVTVALEGEDLYVWVTVLLLQY